MTLEEIGTPGKNGICEAENVSSIAAISINVTKFILRHMAPTYHNFATIIAILFAISSLTLVPYIYTL